MVKSKHARHQNGPGMSATPCPSRHLAEGVGFEPTESCPSHAFEACPFGRSGTLPGRKVNGYGDRCHQEFHPAPSLGVAKLTQGETLKVKKVSAEELSVHADLFARDGGFTPRPAWQVIEAARRQILTGELSLATTPKTHVYLRDGHVYFAERTTDGGLGVRLLVEGIITRQQMGKGALLVSGVEHLGRMFQRDPSIDRQSVELCVELMTDDVLTSVANDVVDHYTMTMYKRHPNGIDRWLPNRIEVITHIVEGSHLAEADAVITAGPGPRSRNTVIEPAAVTEVVVEEVVPEEVVEAELVVEAEVEAEVADVEVADVEVADVEVADVEVADVEVETPAVQAAAEHAITEELAIVESDSGDDITAALALAATYGYAPQLTSVDPQIFSLSDSIGNSLSAAATAGLLDPAAPLTPESLFAENSAETAADDGSSVSLAQSAVDAIMSSAIVDEVAEAVRRALSAIDAAAQPIPKFSPADFSDSGSAPQHDAATSAA